jgi:YfiH family protein
MGLLGTWPGSDSVAYGFTGRAGGVSRGPFSSLNLSFAVGDDEDCVRRNWNILAAQMPPGSRVARMRQVHGATTLVADAGRLDLGDGDAAITATAGVAVAVLTADCVPILLCAGGGVVVAAVHAGWRGTVADIAGAALHAIEAKFGLGPATVEAVIGPSIGPCCYEVGDEVAAPLRQRLGREAARAVVREAPDGKAYVDLRAANRHLLRTAGVPEAAVREEGPCTRCAADAYFSHRAAAGGATGRQAGIILCRAG